MKKILIAASIVGTAAAGFILYMRRRNCLSNKIEDAADDANDIMNKHMGRIEKKTEQAFG